MKLPHLCPLPLSLHHSTAPLPPKPAATNLYPFLTVWVSWQVRQVLSLALRRWGFQVCAVKNEADAITKLSLQGAFCMPSKSTTFPCIVLLDFALGVPLRLDMFPHHPMFPDKAEAPHRCHKSDLSSRPGHI